MARATVPHKWLWRLAVENAIEAGFTIVATDKPSGKDLQLDLSAARPKELLRNVRTNLEKRMRELGAEPQLRPLIEERAR
jgi:hypothetical protein